MFEDFLSLLCGRPEGRNAPDPDDTHADQNLDHDPHSNMHNVEGDDWSGHAGHDHDPRDINPAPSDATWGPVEPSHVEELASDVRVHEGHTTWGDLIEWMERELESALSGWSDAGSVVPYRTEWDPTTFDGVGEPLNNARYWHVQEGQNSCAVVAQISVYESITGECLPEEIVCDIARDRGWFDPERGTKVDDVGDILEVLGIPVDRCYDTDPRELVEALARGDRVMVAVDGNEIASPYRDAVTGAPVELADAGHIVWITGIDKGSDGKLRVILNDSGTSAGRMEVVEWEDFRNAWDDFGNFAAIARVGRPTADV